MQASRASRFLLLAGAFAVAAVLAFWLNGSLAAFEPCRVLYRTHHPVQDSPTCQVHSALGLLSVAFLLASLAACLASCVRWFGKRAASNRNGQRAA